MDNKYSKIPYDWFACPVTKESLIKKEDGLHSSVGVYTQHSEFYFWNFIPMNLKELNQSEWKIWAKLQENSEVAYLNDPLRNLGIGYRQDFLDFTEFCNFEGNILDVGVGPQKISTHIEYCKKENVFFIGIDPLVGEQPRNFAFVQGLGEYLPFKCQLFDQVIFATSIDHFIDPIVPLLEAKRVLKDKGNICIWIGQKDKKDLPFSQSPEWYNKLKKPEGVEDLFHFKKLTSFEAESYFEAVGTYIIKKDVISVDKWRKNLFYKVGKKI